MTTWKWSGRPGHDLHDAIAWVARRIKPRSYLEVGVDGGGSLQTLLKAHRPELVVLVDSYAVNHAGHGFTDFAHIVPILKQNGITGYETIQQDSSVALPNMPWTFDQITIDGDHDEEPTYTDLTNAWPLLNSGGMLVLDDIGHHMFPGVLRAMERFMAETPEAELIPEAGAPYRNACVIRKP